MPLTDQLRPAEKLGDGHWRFPLTPIDTEMPDHWRYRELADTCTLYHGIPVTGLYSLLYHRVMFESNIHDTREQTQKNISGA